MRKILLTALIGGFISLPILSFAVATPTPGSNTPDLGITKTLTTETVGGLVGILIVVVQWVYTIFFIVAVFFILLAAYNYLTSSGEPAKVAAAHKQLLYAAIAIAVALLAVSFTVIVKTLISPATTPNQIIT